MEVLHGPVHSTAIGPPVPGLFQKTGGPPDPLGLALLRGILRSLLVLVPALPGSCRLLGGGNRRLRGGIGKGQGLPQGLHGLLRQRLGLLPGSFPGSGLLLYFLRNHTDCPGAAVRRGDLMGLGQVPQLSSLRAVQSRKQNPMAHALGLPAQCLHAPHGKRRCQNINRLRTVGIGYGIGHHQPILWPGHGYIQHPHLFTDRLLPDPVRNGQFSQRRIADTLLRIRHLDPQTQGLVTQQLLSGIDHIEPVGQVHQKHHREFQALGLVDAHNSHSIFVLRRRPGQSLFRRPLQVLQEPLQCAQLPLLEACSQQIELAQILLGSAPLGPCPIDAFQVRLRKNQLQ